MNVCIVIIEICLSTDSVLNLLLNSQAASNIATIDIHKGNRPAFTLDISRSIQTLPNQRIDAQQMTTVATFEHGIFDEESFGSRIQRLVKYLQRNMLAIENENLSVDSIGNRGDKRETIGRHRSDGKAYVSRHMALTDSDQSVFIIYLERWIYLPVKWICLREDSFVRNDDEMKSYYS